jgi:hypothetical protein
VRNSLILIAITLALFCALSAIFWGVAVSTPHPTPKNAPEAREINWRTWT